MLTEGAIAQSTIVTLFFGLSFAYLLRDERRPILFDLVFALSALLAAIGYTAGFLESVTYYDKVTHTFMTFSVSLAFFFLFYAGSVPQRRAISLATSVFTLGFTIGALWEIFEWRSDAWFGTTLSEDNDDTNGDLVRDTLGSLAGAALLVVWARFGWGSVRRIPGVNTHEEISA